MSDPVVTTNPQIKKRADDVHTFISYAHDDKTLAEALRDELRKANPDRTSFFLDAYSIRSGDRWDDSIVNNLQAADWLVFVYTGRDRRAYDYCGFEMGIFAAVHNLNTSQKMSESARLLCVHDTSDVPAMLSMVQNRAILPYEQDATNSAEDAEFIFYRDSALAQFFEDFYQYPSANPLRANMLPRTPTSGSQLKDMPNVAHEIVTSVRTLVARFKEARKNDPISEKFYQVRMEIDIRSPIVQPLSGIPSRSIVTAGQDTFNLLGLSPDPDSRGEIKTTWGQMKDALISNNETFAWMDKLEDDILSAINQRNLRTYDTAFRAHDDQLYRPMLARQLIYGSGARKFAVIFVRTLPRKFAGDEITSSLLIGLILGSRFRFTFIEGKSQLFHMLSDQVNDAEFTLACRQLIYDVERMEQESSEFGLNSPALLHEAFGEENHEIVNSFYEAWFPARESLFKVLKDRIAVDGTVSREQVRTEITHFAEVITPYNKRFLTMCLQRYTDYLRNWLGDKAADEH